MIVSDQAAALHNWSKNYSNLGLKLIPNWFKISPKLVRNVSYWSKNYVFKIIQIEPILYHICILVLKNSSHPSVKYQNFCVRLKCHVSSPCVVQFGDLSPSPSYLLKWSLPIKGGSSRVGNSFMTYR